MAHEKTPKLGLTIHDGNERVTRLGENTSLEEVDAAAQKEIAKVASFPMNPVVDDLVILTTKDPNPVYRFNGTDWDQVGGVEGFSAVKVGSTLINAEGPLTTLEIAAGTSIVLTPDNATDKLTIAVKSSDFETPNGSQIKADNVRRDASKEFVFETRTNDPVNPVVGRAWLRTDITQ